MDITPEYLRDAAVQAVKEYASTKKPLTETVTAIALRDNLKPEQVKRVVETVNQVAYLNLLESAKDRTFEFPLASYDDIMTKILSPEEILEENVDPSPLQLMHKAAEEDEGLSKEASEVDPLASLSEQQRLKMLHTAYVGTLNEIEKLAHEEREMVDKILSHASKCREDEEFIEKVASLAEGDDTVTKKVSKLVYGQVKKASGEDLFYEEDLLDARKMVSLIKTAEELVERKKGLEKSAQQVQNYFSDKAKRAVAVAKDIGKEVKEGTSRANIAFTAITREPSEGYVWGNLHPPINKVNM